MSRQILVYIGIISQSPLGEEYLDKNGFYVLIRKAIIHNGLYDYFFTCLIDNLNFNTKNALDLIQDILESGSKRLKRYVFEHIRCIFKFGKEIAWSFKNFQFTIDYDSEVNKLVMNILSTLLVEGKYIEDFISARPLIEKIESVKKELLYLMMRKGESYSPLNKFIDEEIKKTSVKDLIETYSKELEENIQEIFPQDDIPNDYYYLHINLPNIEKQYDHFSELFWIKQLPFNINLAIMENYGQSSYDTIVLNTYLEFHDSNRLILYSRVNNEIQINIKKHSIKFICMLGDQIIDHNCKMIYHANFLTFEYSDFKNLSSFVLLLFIIYNVTSLSQEIQIKNFSELRKTVLSLTSLKTPNLVFLRNIYYIPYFFT